MIKICYQNNIGWPSKFFQLKREIILQGCLKAECTSGVWLMVVFYLLFLKMFCIWESPSAATAGSNWLVESWVVTYWQQLLSYREDESDV